jgi:hypothetical protein
MLENDRPHVLREMNYVCRPAGILSVPGGLAESSLQPVATIHKPSSR